MVLEKFCLCIFTILLFFPFDKGVAIQKLRQMDRQPDDGQQAIRKAHKLLALWAKDVVMHKHSLQD